MTSLHVRSAREQADLPWQPYDRWVLPDGECKAEFRRREDGFFIRFPDEVDFQVSIDTGVITAYPVPGFPEDQVENLYETAIIPILGNYEGGLFLHGSAVRIGEQAVAFLGLSRSGKTTLAAAFARSGKPFLTEDVIDLRSRGDRYWLQPKSSPLRLFADSADHLAPEEDGQLSGSGKYRIDCNKAFPFAGDEAPLGAIFVLGDDFDAELCVRPLDARGALVSILPHSFVLDVEDKKRLGEHFDRIGDLAQNVPCFSLDYPRDYSTLPAVMGAIQSAL